jgi:hypothetical protein
MKVALGISPHTGWAVAVVAGRHAGSLVVTLRKRIQLIDENLPPQPYHAADGMPTAAAADLVARVVADAHECARRELAGIRAEVDDVAAMAVVGEEKAVPTDTAKVLASHALMHTAEGELYRRALVDAAAKLGLETWRVSARDLGDDLEDELARIGRELGPPWRKDHKHAVLAALAALERPR